MTIATRLAPYQVSEPPKRQWQFTPRCILVDDCHELATYLVVWPSDTDPLFMCEEHMGEWIKFADQFGTLGRPYQLADF